MARRKTAPKRETLPDPLFHSELLAKFINAVMRNGKKSVAEKIVYGALDVVAKRVQNKSGKEGDGGGESGGKAGVIKKRSLGDIRTDENARALALETFKEALDKVMPNVEVKSRRVGGSTYQVPVEIRMTRRQALARRWLVEYANKRNEKTMVLRLAHEILDALEGRGAAIKKREDIHRMAKANQAFAHYRW
ncbi:30S ribosomal protein S7 [Coxiella endosymbiont of Ornithodoros amblus]|uniref:30S ribosomal protein S7 n=1 Tax=Coxiella endosymbiont of Ornithodoros amblus TaxID=1656166 RepID=UPI00244E3349|nr:30S ribosomal protein S7 [Coxiella endosymbiont of Ornithodoros amblus]MBW5802555.1 30S ribosomal protein S7 [Coxiella endosymbiont of Ornithodoros amblus]